MRARKSRDILVFLVLFFVLITLFATMAWKWEMVPLEYRPRLRIFVWVLPVILWLGWQKQQAPLRWLGLWPSDVSKTAFIALAAFAAVIGWNYIRVHVVAPPTDRLMALALTASIWVFIGVFVEELVFRGVVQTRLCEQFSSSIAVILTSLVFFAIHIPGWFILDIWPGPAVAFSVFLIGLICSWLRHWAKSLWPGVAAHYANNLGALF